MYGSMWACGIPGRPGKFGRGGSQRWRYSGICAHMGGGGKLGGGVLSSVLGVLYSDRLSST